MLLERLSRPVRGVRIVRKGALEHGQSSCVQVIPMRQLDRGDVERLLDHFDTTNELLVTSALAERERTVFLDVGFVEREALHLLRHNLGELPLTSNSAGIKLRTGRRTDLSSVLSIDHRSFDGFWTMDRDSLNAARKATPVHRYTVATLKSRVVGYAITGKSGRHTFLQRLGVDPGQRRMGIGSVLVEDALRWARDSGGSSMLVNTQDQNDQALKLYQRLGFHLEEEKLKVLEWPGDNPTNTDRSVSA